MITILLTLLLAAPSTHAAEDGPFNVISYYADENAVDGQLMIDAINVLRFYPVFAMKEQVLHAAGKVYYGSKHYRRRMEKLEGGDYWQMLLPKFELGEAIQLIEVDTRIKLAGTDSIRAVTFARMQDALRGRLSGKPRTDAQKRQFAREIVEIDYRLSLLGIHGPTLFNQSKKARDQKKYFFTTLRSIRDSLIDTGSDARAADSIVSVVDSLIESRITARDEYLSRSSEQLKAAQLSYTEDLARRMKVSLEDTTLSGPSVRKSHIVVDWDHAEVVILYKNHKKALRFMPALDPSEKMGIFRIRYVPFPVVGLPGDGKMTLIRPYSEGAPTVFEIGLAFGNQVVPGDDLVRPTFSLRRFGIAFAITEKLFKEDAKVIALALTYDFNSYGSVGAGWNFAGDERHGYASLGINKRAFEAVVTGLVGLFKQ